MEIVIQHRAPKITSRRFLRPLQRSRILLARRPPRAFFFLFFDDVFRRLATEFVVGKLGGVHRRVDVGSLLPILVEPSRLSPRRRSIKPVQWQPATRREQITAPRLPARGRRTRCRKRAKALTTSYASCARSWSLPTRPPAPAGSRRRRNVHFRAQRAGWAVGQGRWTPAISVRPPNR